MIGIIDYKAGNAPSVLNACKKIGAEARLVSSPGELEDLTGIILPGVGSAAATLESLNSLGFVDALEDKVCRKNLPFLGICIGMQILFEFSEEGNVPCLGWLKGTVKRFDQENLRVPQMGWNSARFLYSHPLWEGLSEEEYFYFVNSYHVAPKDEKDCFARTDYGGEFTSMVKRDHIVAAQFHVEKSGPVGLTLLENFVIWAKEEGKKC